MTGTRLQSPVISVRPCFKWAGGKTQLLTQLISAFPPSLHRGHIRRYVEPFIGGGALFFHIASTYPVEELVIADINHELMLCYRTLAYDVHALIIRLEEMQAHYHEMSESDRAAYFYEIRAHFNASRTLIDYHHISPVWVERTAQLLFLNHTCYNGLSRFNRKGEFNVPFGRYTNPRFYDVTNLHAIAEILRRTHLHCGDFRDCCTDADESTFFYFDPPYRPISKTASFTTYAQHGFGEHDQHRLADCFRTLHKHGAALMLSNSDPKNHDPYDNFFDDLYSGFRITRVHATRAINSNSRKRGTIHELLITNY